MPLYEYKCDRCNAVFEVIQKFADEPLSVHENCGGAVERLISSPAFQFKGTGWYVTDYAKSGSRPAAGNKESKSESKSEASSTPKETAVKTETTTSKPSTDSSKK